jgi:hypothetical protein
VPEAVLASGTNVLAVEIHQYDVASPDIAFDAMITVRDPSIYLNVPMTINARSLDGYGNWSPLVSFPLVPFVPAGSGNLGITEIHYNPGLPPPGLPSPFSDKDNYEFLELQNTSAFTVDLAGVRFTSGIAFTFPATSNRWLPPSERVLLVKNYSAFNYRYASTLAALGIQPQIAGSFAEDTNLSNAGEQISFVNAQGVLIQDFVYDDTGSGWHPTTDGGGPSLTLKSTKLTSPGLGSGVRWRPSFAIHGTPE